MWILKPCVYFCWGSCNQTPWTWWLKHHAFICSWCWRLEVHDQDAGEFYSWRRLFLACGGYLLAGFKVFALCSYDGAGWAGRERWQRKEISGVSLGTRAFEGRHHSVLNTLIYLCKGRLLVSASLIPWENLRLWAWIVSQRKRAKMSWFLEKLTHTLM